jgi:heme exporter protein D
MIWNSWQDFWAMGGYGVYVWGSFGVTAALMIIEMAWVKQVRSKALSQVAQEVAAAQTHGKDWQG